MSAISTIEWTDRTWNPVRGCSIVSPGCVNCYAMKQAHRFSGDGRAYHGLTKQTKAGPQWTGQIRTVESALLEPLSWRKPARVFVNSMSDLFHEGVPAEFIDRVFAVMALAPQHTFQVLTKRADRMRAYFDIGGRNGSFRAGEIQLAADKITGDPGAAHQSFDRVGWPMRHVWLGVSAEDQQRADERIPLLLQTPAAVRFVSAEPLIGPIDLHSPVLEADSDDYLDWVIVGGESGAKPRPLWVPWARSIVRQCRTAGVACFVKQLGANVRDRNDAGFTGDFDGSGTSWPEQHEIYDRIEHDLDGTRDGYQGAPVRIHLKDRKGGDMAEWPADLRVRQFPSAVPA